MTNPWYAAVLYENLADAATLSASSQISDGLVEMLLNPHVARQWMASGSSAYVIADLGSGMSINSAALINIGEQDATEITARCRMSLTDPLAVSALEYDSNVQPVDLKYRQSVHPIVTDVTVRYVRFDVTCTPSTSRAAAGRIVLGNRYTYTYSFGFGGGVIVDDTSRRILTEGNLTQIKRRRKFRIARLPLGWIADEDRNTFVEDLEYQAGLSEDVLLFTNPDPNNPYIERDTIWGLREEASEITRISHDLSSGTLTVRERG